MQAKKKKKKKNKNYWYIYSQSGNSFENEGLTANMACCYCGGGDCISPW